MNTRIETCRCGHDIDTHFQKTGACLGKGCNTDPEHMNCRMYAQEGSDDAKVLDAMDVVRARLQKSIGKKGSGSKGRPHADYRCACNACREWLQEQWDIPDDADPWP